jgi:hypothetical protein
MIVGVGRKWAGPGRYQQHRSVAPEAPSPKALKKGTYNPDATYTAGENIYIVPRPTNDWLWPRTLTAFKG